MNIKQSLVLMLIATILLLILIIGVKSETQKYAFCECSNCSECEYKLINTSCQVVRLNKNITNQSTVCIHNIPNGKIFDCQGHEISAEKEKNVSYGIGVHGVNNITIKNCKIKNFKQGIYFALTRNSFLDNNKLIDEQENGVVFVMSRNNTISNNLAKNNMVGFYFTGHSFYNLLEHNSATQNGAGYLFYGTLLYNEINNNLGCDNTIEGQGADIVCAQGARGANNTFGIVLNCPDVEYSSCSSFAR